MCGIGYFNLKFVSSKSQEESVSYNKVIREAIQSLEKRGPEKTTILELEGNEYIIHTLLGFVSNAPKQPYIQDGFITVFNGELFEQSTIGEIETLHHIMKDGNFYLCTLFLNLK